MTVLFATIALVSADPGVVSPLVTPLAPVGYSFPSAPLAYSRYYGNAASQLDLRANYLHGYPSSPIGLHGGYHAPIATYASPAHYVSRHAVPSPYTGLYGYGHHSLPDFGYGAHGHPFI